MGMKPGATSLSSSYLMHYGGSLTPKLVLKFYFECVESPQQIYRKPGFINLLNSKSKHAKAAICHSFNSHGLDMCGCICVCVF